jgi:F5/8 type C domain-containing protein
MRGGSRRWTSQALPGPVDGTVTGSRVLRPRIGPRMAVVAALCLGLAACGSSGGTKNTARLGDFRSIEVGKTSLQVAADGRSAIVQVETNPPTVCAIAYGKTSALGSIADDPDMGGTAISRHTVILSNLTPGTTYRYLLTATDAQGLVFQTPDVTTFATPRPRGGPGPDIAIGAKIVAVSSQYSNAYRAANAVDGNLSTEWSSNDDGDRAFITIDLGRQRKVTGISFITREMADGSAITRTFAVVVDGRTRYGPFPAGNPQNPHLVPVSFTARSLRFEVVQSTGGNTGAAEIEVFSGAEGHGSR